AVGVRVEVEGALDATATVIAAQAESKSGSGASGASLEFFGAVNALPGGASGLIGVWNVGGKLVNVTAQTVIDIEEGPIVIGANVEVSGWQQPDGMIDAHKIETQAEVGAMSGVGPQAGEVFDPQLGPSFVPASAAQTAAV